MLGWFYLKSQKKSHYFDNGAISLCLKVVVINPQVFVKQNNEDLNNPCTICQAYLTDIETEKAAK